MTMGFGANVGIEATKVGGQCHRPAQRPAFSRPVATPGQRQHEEARETGMTCIDRHYNLVHDEIEPSQSFRDSTGGTN